ncbi:MAG TPA: inositol monophosphatase family protein, partial [Candidatus Hydrogenedentes bacterium]|nr:inositol monophosphatase family protein [Candidatus Hydrogenedentota bacterium]
MTEIDLIQSLLKEASVYVREQYARRDRVGVQSKGNPNDLLTEADLGVQDLIVEGIRNCFPGDAIAAEERDFAHAPADLLAEVLDVGGELLKRGEDGCFHAL